MVVIKEAGEKFLLPSSFYCERIGAPYNRWSGYGEYAKFASYDEISSALTEMIEYPSTWSKKLMKAKLASRNHSMDLTLEKFLFRDISLDVAYELGLEDKRIMIVWNRNMRI